MSMLRNDVSRHSRTSAGLQHSFGALAVAAIRILQARQARAATKRLLTHDDRILSDIGISRGDIDKALAVGWDQDPSLELAEIRRRRMLADRRGLISRSRLPVTGGIDLEP